MARKKSASKTGREVVCGGERVADPAFCFFSPLRSLVRPRLLAYESRLLRGLWRPLTGAIANDSVSLQSLISLIKQCTRSKFSCSSSFPNPVQSWNSEKKFWIHASNVCGVREGVGPVWIAKRPRNAQVSKDFCLWLKVVVTRDGRLRQWSQGELLLCTTQLLEPKTFIRGPLLNKIKQPRWRRQWERPKRQYRRCFHFSVCLNKVFPLTSLIL